MTVISNHVQKSIPPADPLQNFLGKLEGVRALGDNRYEAQCPGHDDGKASLSVTKGDDGRVLAKCHAGCATEHIVRSLGMAMRDLFPAKVTTARTQRRIVTTYNYVDRDGTLLFQCIRYDPKDFRQRRPNGSGGWIWNLDGVVRVLYRFPELMEADPDACVFIVEGEKDADRLWSLGLVATTCAMGAGKWRDEYSEWLRGRRVAIPHDNDDPGRAHAQQVAQSLIGKAADVRVVTIPNLPPNGDVSDYLDAGGTADGLMAMVEAAPAYSPNKLAEKSHTDGETQGRDASKLAEVARLTTDIGNAARFVLRHGRDVRFCFQWGKWVVWNGRRWEIDLRGRVMKLAADTALKIYAEAADEADELKRDEILKHAKGSQKRERLTAMVELAKSYLAVTSDDFDRDPWLLNAQNGTVDLRTGDLRPHRREDYCTKICRAAYDPNKPVQTFRRFLARIFRQYPALVTYVQKALGYSMTGLTTEQVLFFLFGFGANGKTTMLDLILHVMGDYAGKADRELLIARDGAVHPTNVADLVGRRLVVCSETNEGGRFDEAKLKDLVGETKLKARFMRCDFFEFTATHKIWLYGNHKPIVRGTDFGFWRRMRLVPFVETIADDEKDPDLGNKLQAEADGVLVWLVAGCLLWQQEGLGLPDEIADATDVYRREMDSIGAFLTESCILGDRLEATSRDLYAAYTKWCEYAGEKPLSQKRLGMQLAERGLTQDRDSFSGRKKWLGIGLKAEVDA